MHSTNYTNAFIRVADDCPLQIGAAPPERAAPTIARMQYDLIATNPYRYTSDEIIFATYAARNQIGPADMEARRAAFFSTGQACLCSSPLGKRYGWGIHHDPEGRVALFARESEAYIRLSGDPNLKQVKAMRSAR